MPSPTPSWLIITAAGGGPRTRPPRAEAEALGDQLLEAVCCSTTPHPLSEEGGSESSDSDRDTYFNPDSSQALPVNPEWSRSQALFEDAVGDGTYFADPNFEWEEEVEETKHGGS